MYSEPKPNSADKARPISLIMGKEDSNTLGEFISLIQEEILKIQEDGLCVVISDRAINIQIEIKTTMADG